MITYKLLRKRKNGSLGPLFINRKQVIPIGKWLKAESHPTKGYAFRPGWHTTLKPEAPHLSMNGRVWMKVQVKDYERFERPKNQGGIWLLSKWMRVLGEVI
jgi:hypothetical protein